MVSPVLATAPLFTVLEVTAFVALSRVLGNGPFSPVRDEPGGWVFAVLVIWLFAAAEWFGYGFMRLSHGDQATLRIWRAERFTSYAFWTSTAYAVVMILVAAGAISLRNGLTIVASFSGTLPVLWFGSLPDYDTIPTTKWLRQYGDRLCVIRPAESVAATK